MIFHVYRTSVWHSPSPDVPPCEGARWIATPLPHNADLGYWVVEMHTAAELLAFAQATERGEIVISGDMPTQLAGRCDGTLEIYDDYRE